MPTCAGDMELNLLLRGADDCMPHGNIKIVMIYRFDCVICHTDTRYICQKVNPQTHPICYVIRKEHTSRNYLLHTI